MTINPINTINQYAPWTGFGDDYRTSVKFALLHPEDMFPQWTSNPVLSRHHIRNSNKTITQYHGRTPWTVSLRLMLASIDDLELLDGVVGQIATLRYIYGISKRVGGTKEHLLGGTYLKLPDTLLEALSDEAYEIDGPCEVTATFSRTYDAGSYVGFAIATEES